MGPKCVQKQNLADMNMQDMLFGDSDNAHNNIWKEVNIAYISLQAR